MDLICLNYYCMLVVGGYIDFYFMDRDLDPPVSYHLPKIVHLEWIFIITFIMAYYKNSNSYESFLYDLYYDIYWLEDQQKLNIARLVELKEPTKAPLIDNIYQIDLCLLQKNTVELIATRTKQFKDAWEEKRRLRWKQTSLLSTPLALPSTSGASEGLPKNPPLPKLLLRSLDTGGKKLMYCEIKNESEKPTMKRKAAEDEKSKENKRPRLSMTRKLRRVLAKKQPKVSGNKEDISYQKLKEATLRARKEMENRNKKEK